MALWSSFFCDTWHWTKNLEKTFFLKIKFDFSPQTIYNPENLCSQNIYREWLKICCDILNSIVNFVHFTIQVWDFHLFVRFLQIHCSETHFSIIYRNFYMSILNLLRKLFFHSFRCFSCPFFIICFLQLFDELRFWLYQPVSSRKSFLNFQSIVSGKFAIASSPFKSKDFLGWQQRS